MIKVPINLYTFIIWHEYGSINGYKCIYLIKKLLRFEVISLIIYMLQDYNGVWLSLVERLVRDQEAGSSNLLTPTINNVFCDVNRRTRYFLLKRRFELGKA